MGLIKAGIGAVGGVLADQWREFFYCDALSNDVLVCKGVKRQGSRSSNTKGDDNIISNGSVIAVADGQCMAIIEQGKVVDICAEPGEFVYDSSTEPSIFAGSLGQSIKESFKAIGKRFTFGGDTGKDQRVYYFNTKELIGNKYGTANPVPFRMVDTRAGLDIDIGIRCFGEYSYKLVDPILFYTNVCGNVAYEYNRASLDSQLKSELLTALQPVFASLSEKGIRYSALVGYADDIRDLLKVELNELWTKQRGIEICNFGVSSLKATEEDEDMIKQMQKNAAFMDPTRAAANLVGAQADAMRTAAANEGGAMTGFMGLGMAGQAGGVNAQNLYAMGQQQAAAQPVAPAADSWQCSCGSANSGNFCAECGSPKPAQDGWKCSCGSVNKGKFCPECGSKKPAAEALYVCSKCGWEPQDPKNPPKFCPECGDRFGEEDIKA